MIYSFRVISFTGFQALSLCVIDKLEDKYTENNQRKMKKARHYLKCCLRLNVILVQREDTIFTETNWQN